MHEDACCSSLRSQCGQALQGSTRLEAELSTRAQAATAAAVARHGVGQQHNLEGHQPAMAPCVIFFVHQLAEAVGTIVDQAAVLCAIELTDF